MKNILHLLIILIMLAACKKKEVSSNDNYSPYQPTPRNAYFTGIVIDTLSGDTLTNYDFVPSNCYQATSVINQTYTARASWYDGPVTSCVSKPTQVVFCVLDSAQNIIGSVSSDVDLIENDTVVVNFLF